MVYTWLKKGNSIPRGFFKDEESLLISYDMMPLRGLKQAKIDLNNAGRIAQGELREVKGIISDTCFYVPFCNGKADVRAIDWGCAYQDYEHCLRSLCFFVVCTDENDIKRTFDNNKILEDYFYRSLSRDGRRRRSLPRLKPLAENILLESGFAIKCVEFVSS